MEGGERQQIRERAEKATPGTLNRDGWFIYNFYEHGERFGLASFTKVDDAIFFEKARRDVLALLDALEAAERSLGYAEQRIGELRGALAFYAAPEAYDSGKHRGAPDFWNETAIVNDGGNLARRVLDASEGTNNPGGNE